VDRTRVELAEVLVEVEAAGRDHQHPAYRTEIDRHLRQLGIERRKSSLVLTPKGHGRSSRLYGHGKLLPDFASRSAETDGLLLGSGVN